MIVNTSNLRVARRSYFLNYDGELERWLPPESISAAGFKQLISTDIGAYRYKAVQRGMLQESMWTDPAIVIEKYVTNDENSFYRVYFSGTACFA
jgi:hypothetical protein